MQMLIFLLKILENQNMEKIRLSIIIQLIIQIIIYKQIILFAQKNSMHQLKKIKKRKHLS